MHETLWQGRRWRLRKPDPECTVRRTGNCTFPTRSNFIPEIINTSRKAVTCGTNTTRRTQHARSHCGYQACVVQRLRRISIDSKVYPAHALQIATTYLQRDLIERLGRALNAWEHGFAARPLAVAERTRSRSFSGYRENSLSSTLAGMTRWPKSSI